MLNYKTIKYCGLIILRGGGIWPYETQQPTT